MVNQVSSGLKDEILKGIPEEMPEKKEVDSSLNHAPRRKQILSVEEEKLALKNALRYFPKHQHAVLAAEFYNELKEYGRIYMYRYQPSYEIKARKISDFPHQSVQAAAIMLMLSNNLDHAIAQHPHELITYGGNGSVFQNWAQYRLTMKYLAEMTDEQTLVMYSGHPMGLFPSHKDAPRVVVTNGMMIPNYSKPDDWERFNALGDAIWANDSWFPQHVHVSQGIVHRTSITILNAARKLNPTQKDLGGTLFISAGLGGMSGAQAKASAIAGCVGVVAEINPKAAYKRYNKVG